MSYPCENWSIYALVDPRDSQVRYVGFTGWSIQHRLNQHLASARKPSSQTYRDRWLRQLLVLGLKPTTTQLETGSGESWKAAEMHWIAHFRQAGARLTNLTPGGEGAQGAVRSPETREKIRQKLKGRKPPPLAAIRSTEVNTGRPKPLSAIKSAAEKNRGRKRSDEQRLRMSLGRKNIVLSDEAVRHIRKFKGILTRPQLCKIWGCTQSTVSQVQSRLIYKRVADE